MGNSMRKAAHGPIDGGTVRSSVLATAADDGLNGGEYDSGAVKKLILARRMAPFYEGRVEAAQMARAPDSPELPATDNTRSLSASPPPVATRRKHGFFRTRRKTDLADLPAVTELLETVDTECPICFLYFPKNINYTECCGQALCSACFLSLRRPPSGRTISCPFCNRRDFSIVYKPPIVLLKEEGLDEADRRRLFNPHPVKWESLRPYRPPPTPVRRPQQSSAYRAATTPRYRPHTGSPYVVRSGRNVTNVGGGVLVLYDEHGRAQYFRTDASQMTDYNPTHHQQQHYQQHNRHLTVNPNQTPSHPQTPTLNQAAQREQLRYASSHRRRAQAYYSGFAYPGQYYPEETLRFAAMY